MSPETSVRAAAETDAQAILVLLAELGYPTDLESVRERLSRLLARTDCLVIVAQAETGEICGWLQANSSDVLESGLRVEIVGLVTARKMHRRGVARMPVEEAETWANRIHAPAVVVRSNVNRAESHEFYTALGYANTKTQKVYRKSIGQLGS